MASVQDLYNDMEAAYAAGDKSKAQQLAQLIGEIQGTPAGSTPEGGLKGAFKKGIESLVSSSQTGAQALFGNADEAAAAGAKRSKSISDRYADEVGWDKVSEAYDKNGLFAGAKELASQVPKALAEQAPNLAAMAGSARLGAMAGAPLGPYGAIVGGALGAFAPSALQQLGGNVERQKESAPDKPVDMARAGVGAVGQGAIDVASSAIPMGRALVGKLLGPQFEKMLAKGATEQAEKLAAEKLPALLAKGTAVGAAAEIPGEVSQQMIERWQAGLPLFNDDALKEYKDTAYQTALLAPMGVAGRYVNRSAARTQVVEDRAAAVKAAETSKVKSELDAQRNAPAVTKAEDSGESPVPSQAALWKQHDEAEAAKTAAYNAYAEAVKVGDFDSVAQHHKAFTDAQAKQQEALSQITTDRPVVPEAQPEVPAIQTKSDDELQSRLLDLQQGKANAKGRRSGIGILTQTLRTDPQAAAELANEARDIQAELQRRKTAADTAAQDAAAPQRAKDAVASRIADFKARQAAEAERNAPAVTQAEDSGELPTKPPFNTSKEAGEQWLRERRTAAEIADMERGTKVNKPEMQQQQLLGSDPVQHRQFFGDKEALPDVDVPQEHTAGPTVENAVAGIYRKDTMPAHQAPDTIERPTQATADTLRKQIHELPENVTPENDALVERLYQNVDAFASNPDRANMAAEWLHRLRLGEQVQTTGDATSRPDYRTRDMRDALDALETGKASETETTKTGETRTAIQRDMFPNDGTKLGRTFNTPEQFQQYLGGEGLHRLRKAMGASVQTMARAMKRVALIDKKLNSLLDSIKSATEAYHRHRASYAGLTASAEAAHKAAQDRLTRLSEKLEKEREPLVIEYLQAQQALKFSTDVSSELTRLRMEMVGKQNAGVAGTLDAIARTKEDMSRALSEQMKLGESMKGLSFSEQAQRMQTLQDVLQSHYDKLQQLNAELAGKNRGMPSAADAFFLHKEQSYNRQLLDELNTMRKLHKVYSAAREKLDTLEKNQNRRVTVKRERAAAADEIRQTGATLEATKIAAEKSRVEDVAAGEKAHEAFEAKQKERDAELAPVIAARDERAKRPEPTGAVDIITQVREAAAKRAAEVKTALERGQYVPGIRVTFDGQRRMRNFLADAIPALKELVYQRENLQHRLRMIENGKAKDLSEIGGLMDKDALAKQIKSLTTRIDKIQAKYVHYSALMSNSAESLQALTKRRGEVSKLVDKLGGSGPGGRDEPGISKETHNQRQDAYTKRVRELHEIEMSLSGKRGIERDVIGGERQKETYGTVDEGEALARIEEIDGELQHATGRDRAALFQERKELEMQVLNRLPARDSAPLVRDTRNVGEQRTGSEESKAGKNKGQGSRSRVEQAHSEKGSKRPMSREEMEEANETAAEIMSRKATAENLASEAAENTRVAEQAKGKKAESVADSAFDEAKKTPKRAKTSKVIEDSEELTANEHDNNLLRKNSEDHGTLLSEQNSKRMEAGDVVGVISDLANTSSNPILRRVAAKVQSILTANGVKGEVVDRTTRDAPNAPGKINADGSKISLNRRTGMSEATVVHEAVHAATMHELNKPDHMLTPDQRAAKRELTRMMEELKADPDFTNTVIKDGDIHEFVSESHASEKVQDYMRNKEWDGRPMWRKFVDSILRMVGVKLPPKGNMLDKALDLSEKFMRAKESSTATGKEMLRASADSGRLLQSQATDKKSIFERATGGFGMWLERGLVDMHAPLVRALQATGDNPATTQAIHAVRKADQSITMVREFMTHGGPVLTTDSKGIHGMVAGKGPSMLDALRTLHDIPDALAKRLGVSKVELATDYMAAKLGLRVGPERLGEGVTADKLKDYIAKVDADPAAKKALAAFRETYNQYNEALINAVRDTGAISKEQAAAYLKHKDYIPLYRVRNGQVEMMMADNTYVSMGDIANTPFIHSLKGGNDQVLPLSESILYNTKLMTDVALTNLAKRNVGYVMAAAGKPADKMFVRKVKKGGIVPQGKTILTWNEEPKGDDDSGKRYIQLDTEGTVMAGVPTDVLAGSIEGFHATMPALVKATAKLNDILRAGITRTPVYIIRQLLRDPMSASSAVGLKAGPLTAVKNAMQEYASSFSGKNKTLEELNRRGLVQSNILTGDMDDISKLLTQIGENGDPGVYRKLMNALDSAAHNADAATRTQIWKDSKERGLSDFEAELRVMESMNFHKRGGWASMQYATRMVPFFNSSVQALNVAVKALQGKMPFEKELQVRQKFINNAMFLGTMGLMYAAFMDDQDDEYGKLKPYDRYGNIHINLGEGATLRLPIGYAETGGLAWALGQALYDQLKGGTDTAQDAKALAKYAAGSLPGGGIVPLPTGLKQYVEWTTNTDMRTFQDIVPARLQNVTPDRQYTNDTPAVYRAVGELGISPIKFQHMMDSLLGGLGIGVAKLLDNAVGDEKVESPELTPDQYPFIGGLLQNRKSSEAKEYMYEIAGKAKQAQDTFNRMQHEGESGEALRKYRDDHRAELLMAPLTGKFTETMGQLNNDIRAIQNQPIPAAEKTKRILKIEQRQKQIAERFMQSAKANAQRIDAASV